MRVIAGIARSLPLKTIDGMDTRPTTDRIKETLFNIIMPEIPGALFLDLFAGSGAIGIEALSRGASHCKFVENNRRAVSCIEENLKFTKFSDKADVITADVISYLNSLKDVDFDIIFMDPPYKKGLEKDALYVLSNKKFLKDTTVIIEADLYENFDYVSDYGFEIYKIKEYKTNKHIFMYKKDI